jgi:hypothetical protein
MKQPLTVKHSWQCTFCDRRAEPYWLVPVRGLAPQPCPPEGWRILEREHGPPLVACSAHEVKARLYVDGELVT